MKIFIGTAEIAGMMHFLSSAFRSIGHDVTTCVDNNGTGFFNYQYDVNIKPQKISTDTNRILRKSKNVYYGMVSSSDRKAVFHKEKDRHELYIFIWNGFLKNSIRDYLYLKQQGKRIVSIFLGSDIRHVSAFSQEYDLDVSTWEQWFHTSDLNEQLFRLRKAELYSDAVFSVPDQSGLAIRPYDRIYIPFDFSPFSFNIPGRKIPKIIHIPSRTGIKGTTFIIDALNELKLEGVQFEFNHISGITNTEVHKLLKDADILVDEIYLHGPGTLSLEGIASGCAVATKTTGGEVYDDVICNIDFRNIKEKLRKLIIDVSYRSDLARRAYEKIKIVNDPIRIASDIVNKSISTTQKSADYYPSFFSDRYSLPDLVSISRKNLALTNQIITRYNLGERLNISRMRSERLA